MESEYPPIHLHVSDEYAYDKIEGFFTVIRQILYEDKYKKR
jgi:hypothetical protein